ncbi:hypothetical protein [Cellulomonas fimi]|uniref:Lipoprotein n=1 Tax=Cellulomonas fimi (strain ATCC 484 / DSM 20113 / JCM 1341 / CCUG 24087 / LMG 16345 / NBRC 15513 / NCIMB 8980 / NCTC 7547 / NRS-133) TaxID=590998 RepID=F4H4G6_CELFA|nr:hypothetical protein [Cellulomonas fimi]AEE47761.1 hypothetical protein Celf_3654 [Cellulomonas fimi ATCC 484]NNH06700.1 hypothetical protein [Cellulomonas fimi]VEH36951.1 Uncharacterised protein [Cellulomonas fimi]
MRTTLLTSTVALCVLALAGCATDRPGTAGPSTPAAPASSGAPTPTAASTVATDVAPEVMLTEAAWTAVGAEAPRQDKDGVVEWRLPMACAAGTPTEALAMRTVTHGTGEFESSVGVQQVAVLPDADTAVAEADRLATALGDCTGEPPTLYVVEPLAVGAQGIGLATDYYGASASAPLDQAMGTYVAITRRGTAVTLVALDGGEGTVGAARATVTGLAPQAWEQLCGFDAAGC